MFANPKILVFLFAIPVLTILYIFWSHRAERARAMIASRETAGAIFMREPQPVLWLRVTLMLGALFLFVLALARPLGGMESVESETEGIDIVLAMDISKSMLARDFPPDRLSFMKRQAQTLVRSATGDRFAIVAFAGDAYVHMPMTSDLGTTLTFIERLEIKNEIKQGTAIGDAISTSVKRFANAEESAKVIILFTDGENNKGEDPVKAASIAEQNDVVIYTIGIGDPDGSYIPEAVDLFGRMVFKKDQEGRRVIAKLDEKTLKQISGITGGIYFPALDDRQLMGIYTQLDRSLMTVHQTRILNRGMELAPLYLVAGLILLFIEAGLKYLSPPMRPMGRGRYVYGK